MYQDMIKERLGKRKYDPRHIEGYMRLEYRTLDGLDNAAFGRAIDRAIEAIKAGGKKLAESTAQSYGL